RYRRLIGLLEGKSDIRNRNAAAQDLKAIKRCEITLSPVPMPNVFILGETVAYEGMKRGGAGGFEMTHCETRKAELAILIQQFDDFFSESRKEMIRTHPPDGRVLEQLRQFFKEANRSTRAGQLNR